MVKYSAQLSLAKPAWQSRTWRPAKNILDRIQGVCSWFCASVTAWAKVINIIQIVLIYFKYWQIDTSGQDWRVGIHDCIAPNSVQQNLVYSWLVYILDLALCIIMKLGWIGLEVCFHTSNIMLFLKLYQNKITILSSKQIKISLCIVFVSTQEKGRQRMLRQTLKWKGLLLERRNMFDDIITRNLRVHGLGFIPF